MEAAPFCDMLVTAGISLEKCWVIGWFVMSI